MVLAPMKQLLFVFVFVFAVIACSKPAAPPVRDAGHPPALAPCLEDWRDKKILVNTYSVYFDLVADRCTSLPGELRAAAKSSVEENRSQRSKILLAAARKDLRFRSVCDVEDARADHVLLQHPNFDACMRDAVYRPESSDLSCTIDIGTYLFLDVLAAHLRDDPGGPWLVEGNKVNMLAIADYREHQDCPKPPGPPKPPPVTRTGKVWPYHVWDRAEAVTFNHVPEGPNVGLYAYDEDGWSEHLLDRKSISSSQAAQAVALVKATEGGVEVSKCPFPRHAVILYDGEVPVASINVCFQCGDILIWPPWPGNEIGTPGWKGRHDHQLVLHKQTFPKWKTFFKDDVGFAVEERQ